MGVASLGGGRDRYSFHNSGGWRMNRRMSGKGGVGTVLDAHAGDRHLMRINGMLL